MPSRSWWLALLATLVLGGLLALGLERWSPDPSADVARGSEEAFLGGAWPRELTRQGPQRWAAQRARYRFPGLAPGGVELEVSIRSAMTPVTVAADGLVLGLLDGERRSLRARLESRSGDVQVDLLTEGRLTGTRRLGVLLERVGARPQRRSWPSARTLLLLLGPALLALAAAGACRARPLVGAALAAGVLATTAVALWPFGLLFSPYASKLAAGLALVVAATGAFGAWQERRRAGAGAWALGTLLVALAVQGVAGASPLMVVSDAVFHANKLAAVAAGDFFPVSVTQHARPFRFPYGVSFYALLAPLQRAGCDGVWLVRLGAAAASLLASAALFGLLAAAPVRAGLAVLALQLLPTTFEMLSYGNLSNVFAQALTVAFFAWWAGRARGGGLAGALLLCAACLAHFSAAVVLVVLCAALAWSRRGTLGVDRARLVALGLGLGLTALYYGQFAGLMLSQLPRVREGAGSGAQAGLGLLAALAEQGLWAVARWGWPALLLVLLGRPRPAAEPLARDLLAFWGAGLVLLVVASATPLEVRYLYALTLPLAVAMADGVLLLARRGVAGLLAALALAGWQAWIAWLGLSEAVLRRYR